MGSISSLPMAFLSLPFKGLVRFPPLDSSSIKLLLSGMVSGSTNSLLPIPLQMVL
jgi:hypothetical protein